MICPSLNDNNIPLSFSTQKVFRIKHYAGDVTYRVVGFLDKNTDSLFKDLKSVAFQSSNPIAKEIFPDGESINEAAKRPTTAGTNFKNSLADLVANLIKKNPHYVRCVKPNAKKSAGLFDKELCLHQVRYLGLLENVRVRRAGFAYRQTFELLLNRYRVSCPPSVSHKHIFFFLSSFFQNSSFKRHRCSPIPPGPSTRALPRTVWRFSAKPSTWVPTTTGWARPRSSSAPRTR